MADLGKKVFLPFPKPWHDVERCQRWVNACSREDFTVKNITKDTYICVEHWPGEKGPTTEFPDPLKANLSTSGVAKATRKRKLPKQRDLAEQHQTKKSRSCTTNDTPDESQDSQEIMEENCLVQDEGIYLDNNKTTQTDVTKHELASKIENMILRNELQSGLSSTPRVISNLSYEVVVNHPDQMKHFVGLTSSQFEILHEFLNDVCPLETICTGVAKTERFLK